MTYTSNNNNLTMYLRGLTTSNSTISNVTFMNDTDVTDETDPYHGGSLAGNIIVGIFVFIFFVCIINSWCKGGCDSGDTMEAAQHRARCRQAARGRGPYAL